MDSVRFKNRNIFGSTFDAYKIKANGHLLDMLMKHQINKDGTVKNGNLSELWSYVYLLFLANRHTLDVFVPMHGVRGPLKEKATAKRFVRVVLEYTQKEKIDEDVLKHFINDIVKTQNPKNPILSLLKGENVKKTPDNLRNEIRKAFDIHDENVVGALRLKMKAKSVDKSVVEDLKKKLGEKEDVEKKLDRVKREMMKVAGVTGSPKDVFDVLDIIRKKLKELEEGLANKAAAAAAAQQKEVEKSCLEEMSALKALVVAKMCLVKYVGDIIGEKVDMTCKSIDTSKQELVFKNMSESLKKYYQDMFVKNKEALMKFKELLDDVKNCDVAKLKAVRVDMVKVAHDLTNIYEDLFGSVRCFVRLRPFNKVIDDQEASSKVEFDLSDTTLEMKCNQAVNFKETEFFGVYGPKSTNLDIYTGNSPGLFDVNDLEVTLKAGREITDVKPWALFKTMKQLEHGYSIVIGAYGLSGSGKSGVLIGFDQNYGLLHYGLRNLDGVKKLEIYQAFELYYNYVSPNDLTVKNKIIMLHDASGSFAQDIDAYGVSKTEIVLETLEFGKKSVETTDEVGNFVKNITQTCLNNMKEKGRVKTTPLNNASSRSHLFLVFKILFNDGSVSFFTLTDEAGIENAYSLYAKIFTKSASLPYLMRLFDSMGRFKGDTKQTIDYFLKVGDYGVTNGKEVLTKGAEGKLVFGGERKIEKSLMRNIQILYESFAIVESLLHMKYFFNRRNGFEKNFAVQKIEKGDLQYDISRVFKSPQLEDVYHPSYSKNRDSKVRCLMVPILNYLDGLSKNKGKITKFVMFTALRPDKCAENRESLDFAASINSMGKTKGD